MLFKKSQKEGLAISRGHCIFNEISGLLQKYFSIIFPQMLKEKVAFISLGKRHINASLIYCMVLPVWKKACCSFFWFFDSLYNGMSKGILLVGEAASSSSPPSSSKHLWLSRCRCQLGLISELHLAIPPLPLTAWLLTVIPLPLSRYLLNMGRRRSRLKFTSMESLEIVTVMVVAIGPLTVVGNVLV